MACVFCFVLCFTVVERWWPFRYGGIESEKKNSFLRVPAGECLVL